MKISAIIKTLCIALFITPVSSSFAAENSPLSLVSFVNTYPSGTVYFKLGTQASYCQGYFIEAPGAASAGYDINVSSLLAAFHNNKGVVVTALTSDLWPGSTSTVCKVSVLSVRK
jgi:hypothetical protein